MKATRAGSKGEETRLRILNAAVLCMGRYGERETSFQKIADTCRVSQPLVVHYLKKRENILPEVIKHLMNVTLTETEAALDAERDPVARLRAYFQVSLRFMREQPELGRIYVMLYYKSAYEEPFRKINDRLKGEATERIAGMLKQGTESGVFRIDDVPGAAKTIHNTLTGLLLNILTETAEFDDRRLLNELESMVFGWIRA